MRQFLRAHTWWQTTVFVVGMFTLITVMSVSFLGVDNAPSEISTSEPLPAVDSPHFAAAVAHLVNAPIEQGGTVEVLNNGDEFLPALLGDIGCARSTINTMSCWKPA